MQAMSPSSRLDIEFTGELCISVFLICEKLPKFPTTRKIDEHPLVIEPLRNSLRLHCL